MKRYTISGNRLTDTTIQLPASKSISNRALIIRALAGGGPLPDNLSDCDDTTALVSALKGKTDIVDIGAAGTAMRFLTAYMAATPDNDRPVVITGTKRMHHRPIGILVDALRQLGASIEYVGEEGFPPVRVIGNQLQGGHLDIPGNVSSQFISALLMIGPVLTNGLELRMTGDIVSRPYIDLTLWTMREYGAEADWSAGDTVTVKPRPYKSRPYLIENDWSAASYWYELMALNPDKNTQIRLAGLADGSRQGDSVVRYVFSLLGVKTTFEKKAHGVPTTVILERNSMKTPRLDYDFTNSPDLAQTFVVTCCAMNVPFHFKGLHSLRIKETDRLEALRTELQKLGYDVQITDDDQLIWNGDRKESVSAIIDTYEDHRMAMAFAPLALCRDNIVINNPQVVSKSYPLFWKDMEKAGFSIEQSLTVE